MPTISGTLQFHTNTHDSLCTIVHIKKKGSKTTWVLQLYLDYSTIEDASCHVEMKAAAKQHQLTSYSPIIL